MPGHIKDSVELFIAYSAHKWLLSCKDALLPDTKVFPEQLVSLPEELVSLPEDL